MNFRPCWLGLITAPSSALSDSEDCGGLWDESKCEQGCTEDQGEEGEQSQALK